MYTPRWLMFAALAAAGIPVGTGTGSEPRTPVKLNDELKPLQGTWTLLAYAVDGRMLRGEDAYSTLTIEDDRWTITWRTDRGDRQVEQGTIRVIDTTGQPRVMDLLHDFGQYKGTVTRALYQVEGDVMRYSAMVTPATIGDAKVITATMTWRRKPSR